MVPELSRDCIVCEKLKSKHEELLYSSLYVRIRVDANNVIVKRLLDILMAEDSWPDGLLVRRYFRKKDGQTK